MVKFGDFFLGWGVYETENDEISDFLRAVNLTIVTQQRCQEYYSQKHNVTIAIPQICSFETGKDACNFDSGGPLVWFDTTNTNRYQLLGIISYAPGCATDAPAVNTRVTSYVSWILNKTPDASYCFL